MRRLCILPDDIVRAFDLKSLYFESIIIVFLNNNRHSELCDHDVKISLTDAEDDNSTEYREERYADMAILDSSSVDEHISRQKYGRLTASCLYCGLRERIV